jgi:2-oxo-4-hydroxy-4-carboxy-5-ureidoimidazoline decarboxylase
MGKEEFRAKFGSVFEHSPWVADAAYEKLTGLLPTDVDTLITVFQTVFLTADPDLQLDVLRAHPELACAQAERQQLTSDSRKEQSGAGLDQCSKAEFEAFENLNRVYDEKFGFPFIIAVKGLGRQDILKVFHIRVQNDLKTEFSTALGQVCQIARFRIMDIHNA